MARFIFAAFTETKASLVSLWAASWEARGWTPGLVSPREIKEAGSVRRAIRRRGGKAARLTDLLTINFSLRAGRVSQVLRAVGVGRRGWQTAGLIRFPKGSRADDVANCGRPLCL